MYEEKNDNKGLSFYGTFVLIYTVLNIAAFVILLLTTEWSVLSDDEGDGFWAGFCFMAIGIAAALILGIGPALTFKRVLIVKPGCRFEFVVLTYILFGQDYSEQYIYSPIKHQHYETTDPD